MSYHANREKNSDKKSCRVLPRTLKTHDVGYMTCIRCKRIRGA